MQLVKELSFHGSDSQRVYLDLLGKIFHAKRVVKELIHKGLKRVILAIVHVKKHHMLGHVLAFGLSVY
jgi:hypothetical protein